MKALLSLLLSRSAVAAEDDGAVSVIADSPVPTEAAPSLAFFDDRVVLDASF